MFPCKRLLLGIRCVVFEWPVSLKSSQLQSAILWRRSDCISRLGRGSQSFQIFVSFFSFLLDSRASCFCSLFVVFFGFRIFGSIESSTFSRDLCSTLFFLDIFFLSFSIFFRAFSASFCNLCFCLFFFWRSLWSFFLSRSRFNFSFFFSLALFFLLLFSTVSFFIFFLYFPFFFFLLFVGPFVFFLDFILGPFDFLFDIFFLCDFLKLNFLPILSILVLFFLLAFLSFPIRAHCRAVLSVLYQPCLLYIFPKMILCLPTLRAPDMGPTFRL